MPFSFFKGRVITTGTALLPDNSVFTSTVFPSLSVIFSVPLYVDFSLTSSIINFPSSLEVSKVKPVAVVNPPTASSILSVASSGYAGVRAVSYTHLTLPTILLV